MSSWRPPCRTRLDYRHDYLTLNGVLVEHMSPLGTELTIAGLNDRDGSTCAKTLTRTGASIVDADLDWAEARYQDTSAVTRKLSSSTTSWA
jgi:hypothetical protein